MEKLLTTKVLIVGAGPTGLMAANQLNRFGIDFIIVDKKSGPTRESRALAVTSRSLEIYEQMGLIDEILSDSTTVDELKLFNKGKEKAGIDIRNIGEGLTDYSYMLIYEQFKNEALLARNLEENGGKIHWEHSFEALKEYKHSIEVDISHAGETIKVHADYLIACDGASSPVRHALDFDFPGGTYEHKFFVADTIVGKGPGEHDLIIAPGKFNFTAFFPLTGKHKSRVIGTLPKEFEDKPNEDITFDDIKGVVKETYQREVDFQDVNWFSIYRLHHRSVTEFRKGNVFLAGDSAHIHSPAGGQGMNTGLQDAYNLCWKLAYVIRGQASTDLLDTYHEERYPFAKWLLRFTDRGFNLMSSPRWTTRIFRELIILNLAGLVLSSKKIKRRAFKTVAQILWNYRRSRLSFHLTSQGLKFKAGDRLPYIPENNIYSRFTAPAFHLLHINDADLTAEQTEQIDQKLPYKAEVVEERIDDKWRALGVKKELFVLVRPDNYLGVVADSIDDLKEGVGWAR